MLEVADVLRCAGDAYLQKYGATMPASHRRALYDLRHCRTAVFGGQVYRCDRCGHRQPPRSLAIQGRHGRWLASFLAGSQCPHRF